MPPVDLKSVVRQVVTNPNNMPMMPSSAKIVGICKGTEGNRTGVYGYSERASAIYGERPVFAGFFQGDVYVHGKLEVEAGETHTENLFVKGNVEVSGDIQMTNADVAEDFDISTAETVQPGTVMVFGRDGSLRESKRAYDKRVAGVISGSGDFKPGLILDKRQSSRNRQPVALMGKVFCKVDAQFGAIEVGDLLTTSHTPGHAMKASDFRKAFGSVLGKALRPVRRGTDVIPVLITHQ